jgi:peptidoglycan/xylan/chitin deacetylase (PgdA/CDA1 family)
MTPLPAYYSSLEPFRETFAAGRPVLTYHHVRPPPHRARIRGLYVSPRLFSAQLVELKEAGFSTGSYGSLTAPRLNGETGFFITFDDGFRDVFENALPILQLNGFKSIQFLVSSLLGKTNEWQQRQGDVTEPLMDEAQTRAWLATGQEIGSHTCTHPWLTRISPAAAREEIIASKKALEDRFGTAVDHFCYPYGDWDESVRDLVIEAGYRTACTTEPGVNTPSQSPFSLKRFTARYRSRTLKGIWGRIWGKREPLKTLNR